CERILKVLTCKGYSVWPSSEYGVACGSMFGIWVLEWGIGASVGVRGLASRANNHVLRLERPAIIVCFGARDTGCYDGFEGWS
ncbi:unnamed protein product, partial [Dovyalis caffra]